MRKKRKKSLMGFTNSGWIKGFRWIEEYYPEGYFKKIDHFPIWKEHTTFNQVKIRITIEEL